MNSESLICLEGNVYCSVTIYRNNVYISLREFVSYDEEGSLYPTKTGITLNKDQYNNLLNEAEKIDQQVQGSLVGVPYGKSSIVDLTGNKSVSVFHGYTPTEETLYVLFEDTVNMEKKIYLTANQFSSWMNKRKQVAEKIEEQSLKNQKD